MRLIGVKGRTIDIQLELTGRELALITDALRKYIGFVPISQDQFSYDVDLLRRNLNDILVSQGLEYISGEWK